jgi:hypothetical protein
MLNGTFTKITVNNGNIIQGQNLTSNDIPSLNISKINDIEQYIRSFKLNDFGLTTSNISFNNFGILNLKDPINNQDAVTKKYVDNNFQNIQSGTYSKVTVNSKGLVTLGSNLQH